MNKNEINAIINSIDINNNSLVKINKNLLLTNNQIKTLELYNIDYKNSNSLRDLMIKIENIIDDETDLEELLTSLNERNYYENINK